MSVYKNENGTLKPIASNNKIVDQPLEELVTKEELDAILEDSDNIFDINTADVREGKYFAGTKTLADGANFDAIFVPCEPNSNYTISHCNYSVVLADENKNITTFFETGNVEIGYTVETIASTKYLGITIRKDRFNEDTFMVVKGDTLPSEYIPHTKVVTEQATNKKVVTEIVESNEYVNDYKHYVEGDNLPLTWNKGYADGDNGSLSSYWTEDNKYYRSNVVKLNPKKYYRYNGVGYAAAQTCFYNSLDAKHSTFVSKLNESDYGCFKCPSDEACYVVFSDLAYSSNASISTVPIEDIVLKEAYTLEETIKALNDIKENKEIVICCTGDSVTEGMGTTGAHYARYGESPYPARLTTILKDNGYDDVKVINQGHGGERTADIVARVGGMICLTTEDITIPADNTPTSLGAPVVTDGRVSGTNLIIPYSDANDVDFNVAFTQTSHDTNPLNIDGTNYILTVTNSENFIAKAVADNKETVIPAGTAVFTSNNKNPNVNIIYAGINDGQALTLERFIDSMKACGAVNGGKYIVIGCTNSIFNNWGDLTGTTAEKYAAYKRKCDEVFGIHFIDLYSEFPKHAMDYALSAGYFTDKTAEEIEAMRTKLSNHTIPAEMTYDGDHDGNVHLNEAGYHVMAMLIFERLKLLNYI